MFALQLVLVQCGGAAVQGAVRAPRRRPAAAAVRADMEIKAGRIGMERKGRGGEWEERRVVRRQAALHCLATASFHSATLPSWL